MRVLICPGPMGPVAARDAAEAVAAGWPAAEVQRRPLGEAGGGFVEAMAARLPVEARPEVVAGRLVDVAVAGEALVLAVPGGERSGAVPDEASSNGLGAALRVLLEQHRPRSVWLDLVSDDVHDGGAGFLAALGARASVELTGGVAGLAVGSTGGPAAVVEVDLSEVHALLDGVTVIGVVPGGSREQALLGLRGITSIRGRASGADPADLLAWDAALERWGSALGGSVAGVPGAGACGGVGLAVLALGGRLVSGPEALLEGVRPPLDLVVTGCASYDFGSRGGGVVAEAAARAAELLCPCVVVAARVLIGGREMRTMGVEAAYGLEVGDDQISAAGLAALATRVGRSWRW